MHGAGFLLYFPALLASEDPLCIGIERSLPEVSHSRTDDAVLGFALYHCLGYSIYLDQFGKEQPPFSLHKNKEQPPLKEPYCAGYYVSCTTGRVTHGPIPSPPARTDYLPADALKKEGVWKKIGKVGNYVKASIWRPK